MYIIGKVKTELMQILLNLMVRLFKDFHNFV